MNTGPCSAQVEALIDRAVSTVVSQGGQQLTKDDFTEQLRAALAKLAEGLQASPLTVAHTETVSLGSLWALHSCFAPVVLWAPGAI
jgi:hypothetical protein